MLYDVGNEFTYAKLKAAAMIPAPIEIRSANSTSSGKHERIC